MSDFVPSGVRWHNRHPGMLAHKLRESMGTGQPVHIELRNGHSRTGLVKTMVRDPTIDVRSLPDQGSNLTVHLADGETIKLDDIRSVQLPERQRAT